MNVAKSRPCPSCHLVFPKAKALRKHVFTMHAVPGKCPACQLTIADIPGVARHYGSNHRVGTALPCLWCSELFSTKGLLKKHLTSRHNPHPPIPKVDPRIGLGPISSAGDNYCSRCNTTTSDVKSHYSAKHAELYCKACTGIFETKAEIAIHFRDSIKHSACTLCGKSFGTAEQYEQHVTVDHIVRDAGAQCVPCDKYYKTTAVLEEHVKAIHGQGTIQSGAYFPQYIEETTAPGDRPDESLSVTTSHRELDRTGLQSTTPLTQAGDAQDKVIPTTRDTSPASTDNEECALSDASSVSSEHSLPIGEAVTEDDDKGRVKVRSSPYEEGEGRFERTTGYSSLWADVRSPGDGDATRTTPSPRAEAPQATPIAQASIFPGVETSAISSKNLPEGRGNRSPLPGRPADVASTASATSSTFAGATEPCRPTTSFFACKVCEKMPSDPVVTICGHLFCHRCIMAELSKKLCCPVCNRIMLVRLRQ